MFLGLAIFSGNLSSLAAQSTAYLHIAANLSLQSNNKLL